MKATNYRYKKRKCFITREGRGKKRKIIYSGDKFISKPIDLSTKKPIDIYFITMLSPIKYIKKQTPEYNRVFSINFIDQCKYNINYKIYNIYYSIINRVKHPITAIIAAPYDLYRYIFFKKRSLELLKYKYTHTFLRKFELVCENIYLFLEWYYFDLLAKLFSVKFGTYRHVILFKNFPRLFKYVLILMYIILYLFIVVIIIIILCIITMKVILIMLVILLIMYMFS